MLNLPHRNSDTERRAYGTSGTFRSTIRSVIPFFMVPARLEQGAEAGSVKDKPVLKRISGAV
jgi:hypothetical protein